jgi:hypothetical protein
LEDPTFAYYLMVFQYTKLWGLPHGQGWANEPSDILEAITALELEQREIESDMMEESREKIKK